MTTVSTYLSSPYTYIAGENYLLVVDADYEVIELIPYLDMRLSRSGAEDAPSSAIAVTFCSRQQEPFLIASNGEADLNAFHESLLAKSKGRCPASA
ncbi:hypothetical protein [Paenibacillus methanolicus]|uniref:Uncharacterized protein n=1 Tax=Paenibacillus methanolicus TaxID=582686 RepID=A0A5S5BSP2_9BACL|nr:hypothetical protein [Paenibacillus methanolicus]TYP70201.1 hypothetical protein BCM02_112181 [Paenibacillus methanolicus]